LLVLGVFAVGALTAPAPSQATTTTYTRTASCAGLDFYPTDSATDYANYATLRVRTSNAGTGVFRCDPGLPNRAVVTKVLFTLEDGSVSGNVGPCSLVRSGLTIAGAKVAVQMASVPETGQYVYPGTVRPADTTIVSPTIDNSLYGYWLECSTWGYGGGPLFGFYGATVTYTITSTDG
jgi:hypothetical protein